MRKCGESLNRAVRCFILQRTLLGISSCADECGTLESRRTTSRASNRSRGRDRKARGRATSQRTTKSRPSMTAQQRIVRVRRSYNQWVANQTLEDYALRFTAKSARKWSSFSRRQHRHRRHLLSRARSHRRRRSPSTTASSTRPRDPRRRRADLPHRPADRLLRRELRRRHRPAHPRRRLRLHRLDDHVADLRLVHLPVLRDRSGDHVARARDVLRHSAVRRLRR